MSTYPDIHQFPHTPARGLRARWRRFRIQLALRFYGRGLLWADDWKPCVGCDCDMWFHEGRDVWVSRSTAVRMASERFEREAP